MDNFLYIIRTKLLPWSKAGIADRIVVAREQMDEMSLPYGMKIRYQKIRGKRQVVKGGRLYGNTRLIRAKWPKMGLHETENVRLICVVDGSINYQISNYMLTCRAGDFIFVPEGIPHPGNKHSSDIAFSDSEWKSCSLLFMSRYRRAFQCWLSEYTQDSRVDNPQENYLFTGGQVLQLFDLLIEEISENKDMELCDELTIPFISSLMREVKNGNYLHPGVSIRSNLRQSENEFTVELKQYIGRRLNRRLRLDDVARHFHLSRAQFVRDVKTETGKTFVEFLTDYRVREAKVLLRETEWTVAAIADFLGYNSSHYFQTVFKQNVGQTPTQFRRDP